MKKIFLSAFFGMLIAVTSILSVLTDSFIKQDFTCYLLCRNEKQTTAVGAFDCYFSGGAGYLLSLKGKKLLVLAGYPKEETAKTVNERLKEAGEETKIAKISFSRTTKTASRQKKLREQCIGVLYETANRMDGGELDDRQAKQILSTVAKICHATLPLFRPESDRILSGDVRYCQIALTEELLKTGTDTKLEFL